MAWVSRKIPSIQSSLTNIDSTLVAIRESLSGVPRVETSLNEHRIEDAQNFAKIDEKFHSVHDKIDFWRKADEDRRAFSS